MKTLHSEAQISVASNSQSPFELIKKTNSTGQEIWSARDLQKVLEYSTWQKFEKAVLTVKEEFEFENLNLSANFELTYRASQSGKNTIKQITDYELSRFFCYKLAMRGETDACKKSRTYFAVQTRKQELGPTPQTTNQFDFFRSMIDNLENQAKEIIQIKSEVQTLKETPKTFNISIEKIADLKGVKKMERDELGRSINNCVGKIGKQFGFKTVATPKTDENGQEMFEYSYYLDNGQKAFGPMFFKLQHHFVRELYKKETGREYEGDKSATTGDKEDYQKWLNRYVARNCSDNLPDLV